MARRVGKGAQRRATFGVIPDLAALGRNEGVRKRLGAAATVAGRYIRNTPNFVSGIGALSTTEKHNASTRRVSLGAMMPTSQSRAVA